MDDQTRGETPGPGPGLDAPLKRDRQRLRSSPPPAEPVPFSAATPAHPAGDLPGDLTSELDEPELTAVEELFAPQRTAAVPTEAPAVPPAHVPPSSSATTARFPDRLTEATQRYDLDDGSGVDIDLAEEDLTEGDLAEEDLADLDAPPARRFFGLTRPGRAAGLPVDPPVESLQSQPVHEPTVPYVPPGGFSGPGHPKLGPLAPVPAERNAALAGLDIAAMVAAVVVPPIGLITAIVAVVKGKQLRGWASDLARAAISVSLVMTLVFTAVGGYLWYTETENAEQLAAVKANQRAHALVAAASEPFCGVLAANPTIYSTADPDHGWPAVDAPEGYGTAIANYSAVWAELAAVAPDGIATETAAISERVARIVSIANALGSTNRAGDLLELHAQSDLATVESWYVEYCDAPEIPAE